MNNPHFIAGIDIGGTKIAIALATPEGRIVSSASLPMDKTRAPRLVVEDALVSLKRLASEHGVGLAGAGICCAGPLDVERGLVLAPPNLPEWKDFPLVEFVEAALGIPVAFENDANSAALGEYMYGAGRGFSDVVYLTISTGIGSGFISEGKLVHRLGEAGHMVVDDSGPLCGCGARGCLEAVCSGTAIALRFRERLVSANPTSDFRDGGLVDSLTGQSVVDAARQGDRVAMEVWAEAIDHLALGFANIITMTAPEAVILGGGISIGAGEFLLDPLRYKLKERVKLVPMDSVRVLLAALGAQSGLYGVIALISQKLKSDG